MIEPRISSQDAPTSRASWAWRSTPAGFRNPTVTTMRISSWVLRSGALSESSCDSHAFCAAWSCGNTACSGSSNCGKFQSCSLIYRALLRGPEDCDGDVVRDRLVVDDEWHADAQRVVLDALDVRHDARTLFQLDDRGNVGHALTERRQVVHVHDRIGVERGAPRRLLPLDVVAPARRAERTRVVVIPSACIAVPDEEAPVLAAVPEGRGLEIRRRQVEPHRGRHGWILRSPIGRRA